MSKSSVVLLALALLPAAAHATGVTMSLVPVPPRCSVVGQCLNGAGPCTVNGNCNVGALSPASKLQLDGKKLVLKATISGVTDALGAPVTTDGVTGTNDDYILEIDLTTSDYTDLLCPIGGCPEGFAAAKVDLKKGKAKVNVNLSAVFPSPLADGRPFRVRGASLRRPPTTPSACPGDNSPTGVAARAGDAGAACLTGAVVGMGGFVVRQ